MKETSNEIVYSPCIMSSMIKVVVVVDYSVIFVSFLTRIICLLPCLESTQSQRFPLQSHNIVGDQSEDDRLDDRSNSLVQSIQLDVLPVRSVHGPLLQQVSQVSGKV